MDPAVFHRKHSVRYSASLGGNPCLRRWLTTAERYFLKALKRKGSMNELKWKHFYMSSGEIKNACREATLQFGMDRLRFRDHILRVAV